MEDLSHYNPEGSDLRAAQMRMLEILEVFDRICKKHHICYWLCSGTLLGARRHKGFIPWDDDLDVEVFRKDYKRLIRILEKELPSELKLQTRNTDKNYWLYWPKIRDTRSTIIEDKVEEFSFKYNGLFIDIFPLEYMPSNAIKKIIDDVFVKFAQRAVVKSNFKKIYYSLMILLFPICYLWISGSRLFYKVFKGKYLGYSYGIFYYPKRELADILPVKEILFENKLFQCPNNVDKYLEDYYGKDYMNLPADKDREVHTSQISFE